MTKFFLFVALFFINASTFSQTAKETKDLFCHKWKVTHTEDPGKEKTLVPQEGEIYLEIKADGTMISIGFGKKENGKWSYDHNTKTIKTEVKELVAKWEVIKVTENELILKKTVEKQMAVNLIWKKVD